MTAWVTPSAFGACCALSRADVLPSKSPIATPCARCVPAPQRAAQRASRPPPARTSGRTARPIHATAPPGPSPTAPQRAAPPDWPPASGPCRAQVRASPPLHGGLRGLRRGPAEAGAGAGALGRLGSAPRAGAWQGLGLGAGVGAHPSRFSVHGRLSGLRPRTDADASVQGPPSSLWPIMPPGQPQRVCSLATGLTSCLPPPLRDLHALPPLPPPA